MRGFSLLYTPRLNYYLTFVASHSCTATILFFVFVDNKK